MSFWANIPNSLTILRGLLAPLVAWLLVRSEFAAALWCFAAAGATDWLDGFVARRFGFSTRLGAILDPAADKLLLATSFFVLGWLRLLPLWLVFVVVTRDLVIVAGAAAYWRIFGSLSMAPLFVSKVNTVCQILLVVGTVAAAAGIVSWGTTGSALAVTVALTTVISGARYVWVWSRKSLSVKT
jgi:cardiolipin synthase (CMP-forming)